ncbi:hypothetical protein TVAG_176970 [Trichomonas vaginalis G3]|uniref:Mitochondrial fission 1 protein n=1 Tax=Trichomonas vaginalis (strain ATCC PRA-98 / G3) TaxID=412133 RepID=A2F9S9_TRIV3|nr:TPR-like family [Trichomonas vaginalis G3]EAX98327.1 hypothetical protein TVAG_176970 [Trichomonas vaginalis G3]KAI5494555.1 TPR-like family [Trichomonas vaginalis G3]|eukprot:XP_001311257.1 hypothetical protein [Trichomonas vaginalis G3]
MRAYYNSRRSLVLGSKMRSCQPYFQPASENELVDIQSALDDDATFDNLLKYALYLSRSNDERDVAKAISYIDAAQWMPESQGYEDILSECAIFCYYRLRQDDTAKSAIQAAYKKGVRSRIIAEIKQYYEEETLNDAALYVGAGGIIAGAALLLFSLFRRKKH